MEKPTAETLEKWHKDSNNWKFGGVYYNKEDKRILVPKQIKSMGWTLNFAHTLSYFLFFGSIVLVILLLIFFSPKYFS